MKSLTIYILLLMSLNLHAEDNKIEELYRLNNISGSILIESLDGNSKYQYNVNESERFIPASTFKIPNTLIVLEEGLIKDPADVIKWDGVKREYASWNKDQTLKSAFQYSCVWCYQRYAKQVGNQKYRAYLRKLHYGNTLTGNDISRFWLDGELKISVQEQINFMRKVHSEELPIQNKHLKTLKNIMLSETHKNYTIWSKTGWSGKDGWYVGYLLIDNKTWLFANHIEINSKTDLKFRKQLTIDSFHALQLIQ
ncbi:MAG: penicillin-binding transpeptidase domain-containing protein [Cycloclasticus sp.]